MRRLTVPAAALAAVLYAAGCGTTETPESRVQPSLAGIWRSTSLEGADRDQGIREVEFTFTSGGTFRARAETRRGQTEETLKRSGTYEIAGDTLVLIAADGRRQPPVTFRFENGELLLEDIDRDSLVRLRRVAEAE